MPSCAFRYCTNNTSKDRKTLSGITFHRFPIKWVRTRDLWIRFIRRNRSEPTWTPKRTSIICSAHFKSEDKYLTPGGRVNLLKTAVPYDNVYYSVITLFIVLRLFALAPPNYLMLRLLREFPCLWDESDFNYDDILARRQAKKYLLEVLNSQSVFKYTMEILNRKLRALANSRFKTMKQLVSSESEENQDQLEFVIQRRCQAEPVPIHSSEGPPSQNHEEADLHDTSVQPGLSQHSRLAQEDMHASNPPEAQAPSNNCNEQCRLCGQFPKEFVGVTSEKPYLVNNRTSITLNGLTVDLDFNPLPKSICWYCDGKLQEIYNFVNQVKAAQYILINVTARTEDIEILSIKSESSSEDKEIIDSVTVGETEFIQTVFNYKRKNDTQIDETNAKKQRPKVAVEVVLGKQQISEVSKEYNGNIMNINETHADEQQPKVTKKVKAELLRTPESNKYESSINEMDTEKQKPKVCEENENSSINVSELIMKVTKEIAKQQKNPEVTKENNSSESVIDIKEELIWEVSSETRITFQDSRASDTGIDLKPDVTNPSDLDMIKRLVSEIDVVKN